MGSSLNTEGSLVGTVSRRETYSVGQEPFRMPVDQELLDILACPNCKTKVELVKDGAALKCNQCKRVYPIKEDIPVMLIDEATIEP